MSAILTRSTRPAFGNTAQRSGLAMLAGALMLTSTVFLSGFARLDAPGVAVGAHPNTGELVTVRYLA